MTDDKHKFSKKEVLSDEMNSLHPALHALVSTLARQIALEAHKAPLDDGPSPAIEYIPKKCAPKEERDG